MVLEPGRQLAGHTSPCSSVNLKAWTRRRVSSTELRVERDRGLGLWCLGCYLVCNVLTFEILTLSLVKS